MGFRRLEIVVLSGRGDGGLGICCDGGYLGLVCTRVTFLVCFCFVYTHTHTYMYIYIYVYSFA